MLTEKMEGFLDRSMTAGKQRNNIILITGAYIVIINVNELFAYRDYNTRSCNFNNVYSNCSTHNSNYFCYVCHILCFSKPYRNH